jgi:hypothetical protein
MRVLLFSIILFCSCSKDEAVEVATENCPYTKSGLHLSKMVSKFRLDPYSTASRTDHFFYDINNNLDSIYTETISTYRSGLSTSRSDATKLIYNDNNVLDQKLYYDLTYGGFSSIKFEYDLSGSLVKLYNISKSDGTYLSRTFITDNLKRIKSYRYPNRKDNNVITYDECSNVVKQQAFYDADGSEHYLAVSEYSDIYNPLYYHNIPIGLLAFSNSPYLMKSSQIVHWDCADFASGKLIYEYEVNSFNLPKKCRAYYEGGFEQKTVEYFY